MHRSSTVQEEPGEDNGGGSQSHDWSLYWELAGAITLMILDGKGGKSSCFLIWILRLKDSRYQIKGLFRDCVILSLTDGQKIELASVLVSLGLCNRCTDGFWFVCIISPAGFWCYRDLMSWRKFPEAAAPDNRLLQMPETNLLKLLSSIKHFY